MGDLIGRLVISKAGRDQGKAFVIIKVVNDRFVMVADGDLRPLDNPKLKSMKHLQVTNRTLTEIVETIGKGEALENHRLRKLVRSLWAECQDENREGGSLW
ncbi:MAG: RNA-binding protein [Acidobacteriota bacterium]